MADGGLPDASLTQAEDGELDDSDDDEHDEEGEEGDEETSAEQQQATLAVLRGLQKLENATPDNFETLRKEFERVLEVELPKTGAQDVLQPEITRVLECARQACQAASGDTGRSAARVSVGAEEPVSVDAAPPRASEPEARSVQATPRLIQSQPQTSAFGRRVLVPAAPPKPQPAPMLDGALDWDGELPDGTRVSGADGEESTGDALQVGEGRVAFRIKEPPQPQTLLFGRRLPGPTTLQRRRNGRERSPASSEGGEDAVAQSDTAPDRSKGSVGSAQPRTAAGLQRQVGVAPVRSLVSAAAPPSVGMAGEAPETRQERQRPDWLLPDSSESPEPRGRKAKCSESNSRKRGRRRRSRSRSRSKRPSDSDTNSKSRSRSKRHSRSRSRLRKQMLQARRTRTSRSRKRTRFFADEPQPEKPTPAEKPIPKLEDTNRGADVPDWCQDLVQAAPKPRFGRKAIRVTQVQIRCLLGKGGETIQGIMKWTGSQIMVTSSPHAHEGDVTIAGNVEPALEMVRNILRSKGCPLPSNGQSIKDILAVKGRPSEQDAPGLIEVPTELVGSLIGKKGAYLTEIASQVGGEVIIQKLPYTSASGCQWVQVAGDNWAAAKALVLQRLAMFKPSRPGMASFGRPDNLPGGNNRASLLYAQAAVLGVPVAGLSTSAANSTSSDKTPSVSASRPRTGAHSSLL